MGIIPPCKEVESDSCPQLSRSVHYKGYRQITGVTEARFNALSSARRRPQRFFLLPEVEMFGGVVFFGLDTASVM